MRSGCLLALLLCFPLDVEAQPRVQAQVSPVRTRLSRAIRSRKAKVFGAALLLLAPTLGMSASLHAQPPSGRPALAATVTAPRVVDSLSPQGAAVPLGRRLPRWVGGTERLAPEALAPFATVEPLESAADLYTAKTLVDVRQMIEGLAETLPPDQAAAVKQVLAPQLTNRYVLRLPAHQFHLGGGTVGNRVAFYGGRRGHADIDAITQQLAKRDLTLVKAMTEFHKGAQGGTLQATIEEMVSGVHHIGGFSQGMINGLVAIIRSDWPTSYGILGDANVMYNAHLLAVDYQAGAHKPIPLPTLKEYARSYNLWDALTGITVGFTSADQIPDHRPYTNNPLEIYDRDSLHTAAKVFGTMDRPLIHSKGTNYCAEGRWNAANLAPNVLVKKGRFAGFDTLIDEFQRAPGLDKVNRSNPEVGWKHLAAKGLISEDEYQGLLRTNRVAVYLDWSPDHILEYEHYQPKQKDGFVADPMTLAGLVRGLFRAHYPRDKVGQAVASELLRVHRAGGAPAHVVEGLLRGLDPSGLQGQMAAQVLGVRLASMSLATTLEHPRFKELVLGKLGYQFIADDGDKRRVDAVYRKFVDALKDPSLDSRDKLDLRLSEIDRELAGMKVRMFVHDPVTLQRTSIREVPFWSWAPPQAWVWWAQYPNLWNSHAIRYVATAMHETQAKP